MTSTLTRPACARRPSAAHPAPGRPSPSRPRTPYLELDVPAAVAAVRRAGRRAARHRGALRGQGQPAPAAARRAGRRRLPLRRGQPGRGARRAAGRCRARTTSSTPTRSSAATTSPRPPALGVRLFVVDSLAEIAQGRRGGAGQPGAVPPGHLRRGVGLAAVPQVRLLDLRGRRDADRRRTSSGLDAAGVSFHVGSQQRDPEAWGAPDRRRRHGSSTLLRDSGLRPADPRPRRRVPGRATTRRLPAARGVRRGHRRGTSSRPSATDRPQTIVEPGRGIVGDAGTLVASVIGVVERGRRPLGVPRRRRLHRAGRDARRGDPLPAGHHAPTAPRRDRACSPGRPATAPTCSTRTRWSTCRSRWPRATRSGCCRPAPTPAATRPWASTASSRCRPC